MKGIGPVAIVLIMVAAGLVCEGVFFSTLLHTVLQVKLSAEEREVLSAINKVEFVRRGLPHALYYSYSQAVYEVLKKGGCERCGLWKDIPEIEKNVTKRMSEIFSQYSESSEVFIPKGEVKLDLKDDSVEISFESNGLLIYKTERVEVQNTANSSVVVKSKLKKMIELAEEVFSEGCVRKEEYLRKEELVDGIRVTTKVEGDVMRVNITDEENVFLVYDEGYIYSPAELLFEIEC